jgi:hypothetical protein
MRAPARRRAHFLAPPIVVAAAKRYGDVPEAQRASLGALSGTASRTMSARVGGLLRHSYARSRDAAVRPATLSPTATGLPVPRPPRGAARLGLINHGVRGLKGTSRPIVRTDDLPDANACSTHGAPEIRIAALKAANGTQARFSTAGTKRSYAASLRTDIGANPDEKSRYWRLTFRSARALYGMAPG